MDNEDNKKNAAVVETKADDGSAAVSEEAAASAAEGAKTSAQPVASAHNVEADIPLESGDVVSGIVAGLSERDLTHEVQTAFLDYSMSVIVARAIPDVRDGLKPVQRRIIFGMDESGMQPGKPYKKCARIVGDVMGKYHPHGDQALYLTLVRLAQPFSMRYTLVDGHGNFGSIDGDEPAAYRYTEARMNKLSLEMVRDLDSDTVNFVDNYDGTEKEPEVLPSRFPNLLVNGSQGIAVGMATNMPPHNMSEAIDACIAVAKNPDLTPLEIMQNYLHGPDFPTGGIILGRNGIKDAYETGSGSITIKSRCHIEEEANGKARIIVTEIPYQVNKSTMIETIAQLVRDKIIDGITDVRDESNKEGIRVVIEVRRDAVPEVVLNNLFKHTQLQSSFGIINLCLVDGAPKVLPINEIIKNYVEFQISVLTRRTSYLLKRDSDRLHIVNGLIHAHDNNDAVIDIIKASKTDDESYQKLNQAFGFTEIQVQAILAMTLRRLQGLEYDKLVDEKKTLEANITEYHRLLSSKENIIELLIKELLDVKDRFGDSRMTEISDETANIENEDLLPRKEIIVVLTNNGYLKRMDDSTFRAQNRGGRGVKGISTTSSDVVSIILHAQTHTDILLFSSLGKIYKMRGYQIPDGSRIAKGMPVVNLLNLDRDEKIVSIIPCDSYPDGDFFFFVTAGGVVKRTPIKEFESVHSNGKIAISLREGDILLDVKHTNGSATIALAASNGKVCRFAEDDVRSMGRTASGVKGMDVSDGSKIVDIANSLNGPLLLVLTALGYGKMSYADDTTTPDGSHYDGYRLTSRGAKGVYTVKSTEKNGKLVAFRAVCGDEDLIVITKAGIVVRTPLAQVKISGRNTQGVKIIKLGDGERVASIAIVPHADDTAEPIDADAEDAIAGVPTVDETPKEAPVSPNELDDGLEDSHSDDSSSDGDKDI